MGLRYTKSVDPINKTKINILFILWRGHSILPSQNLFSLKQMQCQMLQNLFPFLGSINQRKILPAQQVFLDDVIPRFPLSYIKDFESFQNQFPIFVERWQVDKYGDCLFMGPIHLVYLGPISILIIVQVLVVSCVGTQFLPQRGIYVLRVVLFRHVT